MKREIKFRAKKLLGGVWIYGDLVRNTSGSFAIVPAWGDKYMAFDNYEVDPNTVGQFTGLKDKNGKEIYDSDIVKTKYGRMCVVAWFCSSAYIGFDMKPIESKHPYPSACDLYLSDNLEVIGNIYDNPEYLKKS